MTKFGHVRSRGQVYAHRVVGALARIVKVQAFANFARLDAHGGVVTGVVAGGAAEHFDSDGPLFEHLALPVQRVLDHVAQKFLAALAGPELVAGEDAVQLFADLLVAVRHLRTNGTHVLPQRHEFYWFDSNRSVKE